MAGAQFCHFPSGSSIKSLLHYAQQINFGFYGKYKEGLGIPSDFPVFKITAPISLHYSPVDKFTNPKDVNRLISKLSNDSLAFVQVLNQRIYNHIDLVTGIHAASDIYKTIQDFFSNH